MSRIKFKKGNYVVCHFTWKGMPKQGVRGVALESGETGVAQSFMVRFRNQDVSVPGSGIYMVSDSPILAPQSKNHEPETTDHQDHREAQQGH